MYLKSWKKHHVGRGTRVFVRIDGNVPIVHGFAQDGDRGRIAQTIPEIVKLRAHGARIILATHLGDPKGRFDKRLMVDPVAYLLEKKLRRKVHMLPALNGPDVERAIMELDPGQIAMLPNLRFDPGEEMNSAAFAKSLARLADAYVNNAFGTCHRKHASIVAITKYLPSFAGELVMREVRELSAEPKGHFVLVMGGAKLSTKIPILERFGPKADRILLGGAIMIPFLKGLDRPLCIEPKEFVKHEDVFIAQGILRKFMEKILLPEDIVIDEAGCRILDIGPVTSKLYEKALRGAKTLLWNGPMGVIEDEDGGEGTQLLAAAIKKAKIERSIIGGGESVDFLEMNDLLGGFTHVSTGGGAMLAFLAGEKLPGLEVLRP